MKLGHVVVCEDCNCKKREANMFQLGLSWLCEKCYMKALEEYNDGSREDS